jgi:hypothetical protein
MLRAMRTPLLSVAIAALALTTGCDAAPPDKRTQPSRQDRAEPRLTGRWQVAAIDGASVTGVALMIDERTLTWEPECAGWSRSYRRDGLAIRFAAPPAGDELRIVCSIGYPDTVPALFDRLPDIEHFEAIGGAGIRLSGRGHVIDLERPVSGAARPVRTLAGRWRASVLDGTPLRGGPLLFEGDGNTLRWQPACARQQRGYLIESYRIAFFGPPTTPIPDPPPPNAPPPPPVCPLPSHPELTRAFAIMAAATNVRPIGKSAVEIRGGGRSMTLTRVSE